MTTKTIIQNMEKELSSNLEQLMFAKHETRNKRITELFIHHNRSLLSAFAEEVIEGVSILATKEDIVAVQNFRNEQRLKAKEIIGEVGK